MLIARLQTNDRFTGQAVVTVAASPNGGWTEIAQPQAYQYNGKVYLGWVNGSTGDVSTASFTESTQTLSTPFVLHAALGGSAGSPDNHDAPSVIVRASDQKLVTAYSAHQGAHPLVRISTNAEDPTAWAAEQSIGSSSNITYCSLFQLRSVTNQPIYLMYRNISGSTGRLAYRISTDGGVTWGSEVLLFTGASTKVPYWRIGSDWQTRLDVFITDESPNAASSLGHFYIDGTTGNYYKSDGTQITTTLPFGFTSITTIATNVSVSGSIEMWGACWDGARPATVFMANIAPTNNTVYGSRWNGSAWVNTSIANTNGILDSNFFASGAAIHPTDPNIIWFPQKVSGIFEMYRWVSLDSGATWTGTALTSASAHDNVWPAPVVFPRREQVVWLYGDYTSDTSYAFAIRAYG